MEGVLEMSRPRAGVWGSAGRKVLPVILGFLPVGFAFGVLAVKSGMAASAAVLMSLIVYAGSAQLVSVGMLAAGASPLAVVAATFVINLRHLLMSAALAPYLKSWPRRLVALMTFEMTDETFALHASRFAEGDMDRAVTLAINVMAHAAWVGGTLLGCVSGGLLADVRPLGLDFALPAMFLALLAGQCRSRAHLLAGVAGGAVSLGLLTGGLTDWNVILAAVAAASLALGVHTWTRK